MLETVDGYVKIDGDDVAKLPLGTHRARLNIIPQVCLVLGYANPLQSPATQAQNFDSFAKPYL